MQYALICTSTNSGVGGCLGTAGTIGTWNLTTFFIQQRDGLFATAYNGYLYVVGGLGGASANDCTATSNYCNGVQKAEINTNGSLGTWSYVTTFTQARYLLSGDVYNGNLYISGGTSGTSLNDCTATTDYCTGIQYAGLQSIPRVGKYSMLVNMGQGLNATPAAIIITGTNTGNTGTGGLSGLGGMSVQYENGTATCAVLSPPTTVNLGPQEMAFAYKLLFTSDGCSNITNQGVYAWVHFNLDDSQTASYPDSLGNLTTVTAFQIYYHAADSARLRGGMSLQNGVQQSLDAPPATTQ